jgi:hypothetical protein
MLCSPSPLIDAAWHELVSFTKLYATIWGPSSFIHYNPTAEVDDVKVKAKRYIKTLAAYRELFGALPENSDIWPAAYPGWVTKEPVAHEKNFYEGNRSSAAAPVNKKRKPPIVYTYPTSEHSTPPSPTAHAYPPSTGLSNHMIHNTLTGHLMTLSVEMHDTAYDLKRKIQRLDGTPPDQQSLLFNGKQLADDRAVSDYKIPRKAVVHLILRLGKGG